MASPSTPTPLLPEAFLQSPAPNIKVSRIDFQEANLPMYKGLYAVILDDVLMPDECSTLVAAAEGSTSKGWERAMINIGGGRQRLMTDERNCGRIIWDSRDVVARIWTRVEHLPEVQEILRLENMPRICGSGPTKWNEVWKFTRPNERMRFLKYTGGEYFRPHCDGSYETPDRKERSYFTLHLYLNNAEVMSGEDAEKAGVASTDSVLVGGATTFHAYNMVDKHDVLPKAGRILLFQHRDLIHSGDDVLSGTKYTMRTDLMYSLETGEPRQRGKPATRSKMPVVEGQVLEGEGTDGLKEAKAYGYLNV